MARRLAITMTLMGAARDPSSLAAALEAVGDRWTLQVVDALLDGPRRFADLEAAVAGIAPNVLSQRLKALEAQALLRGRPYSTRPPRLEYSLTGRGRELAGALRVLAHWGSRAAGREGAIRHATCGTPMEPRWFCATCARPVDEHEADELRHL